jgi:F0F1-type ATP synthase assembly protein I
MIDEIRIYRAVSIAFLAGLPIALVYIILPARTPVRKRIRWGAGAFVGFGICFVGWASSWPGPNSITLVMIFGGLFTFLVSVCALARLCLFSGKPNA